MTNSPDVLRPVDGAGSRVSEAVAPAGVSPDLGQVVGRALEFQGFLLRRAWGLYYLVWALALAIFFVVPGALARYLALASLPEAVLYDAVQGAAIVLVLWVTWWAVAQSGRAGRLRDALEGRPRTSRVFLQIVAWGAAITVLVVTVGFVSALAGFLVLDASVGGIVLWLLVQARRWFRPVPPEATLAVAAFAVSVASSAVVLVLTRQPVLFAGCWLLATACWAFAGAYGLFRAPEEMTRGVGQ